MDTEEEKPKTKEIETIDLEVMSINALVAYLVGLQSEIDRVETEICFKKKARQGAESLFR